MIGRKDPIHVELGKELLLEARQELNRADAKASILLASAGVAAGAIIAALMEGHASPAQMNSVTAWLWWYGAATGLAGIGMLGWVIYPRTKYRASQSNFVGYFGDVMSTPKSELVRLVGKSANNPEEYVFDQVEAIAAIGDTKYWGTQKSLVLLGFSVVVISSSGIAQLLTS